MPSNVRNRSRSRGRVNETVNNADLAKTLPLPNQMPNGKYAPTNLWDAKTLKYYHSWVNDSPRRIAMKTNSFQESANAFTQHLRTARSTAKSTPSARANTSMKRNTTSTAFRKSEVMNTTLGYATASLATRGMGSVNKSRDQMSLNVGRFLALPADFEPVRYASQFNQARTAISNVHPQGVPENFSVPLVTPYGTTIRAPVNPDTIVRIATRQPLAATIQLSYPTDLSSNQNQSWQLRLWFCDPNTNTVARSYSVGGISAFDISDVSFPLVYATEEAVDWTGLTSGGYGGATGVTTPNASVLVGDQIFACTMGGLKTDSRGLWLEPGLFVVKTTGTASNTSTSNLDLRVSRYNGSSFNGDYLQTPISCVNGSATTSINIAASGYYFFNLFDTGSFVIDNGGKFWDFEAFYTTATTAPGPTFYWCPSGVYAHKPMPGLSRNLPSIKSMVMLARSQMITNVAPEMYRSGSILGVQVPKGDHWAHNVPIFDPDIATNDYLKHLNSIDSAVSKSALQGMYGWIRPVAITDFDFHAYFAVNDQNVISDSFWPVYNGETVNSYLIFHAVLPVIVSTTTTVPPQSMIVTDGFVCEYTTDDEWRSTDLSKASRSDWEFGLDIANACPQFTENPLHVGQVWSSLVSVFKKGARFASENKALLADVAMRGVNFDSAISLAQGLADVL